MKSKKFLSSPWTIAIIAPIITLLLIKIFDSIVGTEILKWFINTTIVSFQTIIGFFAKEFNWKVYQLIFLFLSGPLLGIGVLWLISKTETQKEEELPEWFQYTRDSFDNINYRWEWIKGRNGKYQIANVTAHCPKCDCRIINSGCPNCRGPVLLRPNQDYEIEPLIHHRIEKRNMK